jgi:hypothetical protein
MTGRCRSGRAPSPARSAHSATLQNREDLKIAAGVRGAPRGGAMGIGQVRVGAVGE